MYLIAHALESWSIETLMWRTTTDNSVYAVLGRRSPAHLVVSSADSRLNVVPDAEKGEGFRPYPARFHGRALVCVSVGGRNGPSAAGGLRCRCCGLGITPGWQVGTRVIDTFF